MFFIGSPNILRNYFNITCFIFKYIFSRIHFKLVWATFGCPQPVKADGF